jgi:hypothetical protein
VARQRLLQRHLHRVENALCLALCRRVRLGHPQQQARRSLALWADECTAQMAAWQCWTLRAACEPWRLGSARTTRKKRHRGHELARDRGPAPRCRACHERAHMFRRHGPRAVLWRRPGIWRKLDPKMHKR